MTKIHLGNLTCIQASNWEPGADEVYAKILIDNKRKGKIRWPITGNVAMNDDDKCYLNLNYEFKESFKIEFWEEDWFRDDFLGSHEFKSFDSGSKEVRISNKKEGNIYLLDYDLINGPIKTVCLKSAKCVAPSSVLNKELMDKVAKLSGKIAHEFGKVIQGVPNPKAKVIGEALDAASKVINDVPDVAQAIEKILGYPDQLYITTNNQSDVSRRSWPKYKDYENVRSGQIVRFNDDLVFPLTRPIDLSFWEYDTFSSSDFLGSLPIEAETKPGIYVKEVISKTESSIYLVAYSVQEEELRISR